MSVHLKHIFLPAMPTQLGSPAVSEVLLITFSSSPLVL